MALSAREGHDDATPREPPAMSAAGIVTVVAAARLARVETRAADAANTPLVPVLVEFPYNPDAAPRVTKPRVAVKEDGEEAPAADVIWRIMVDAPETAAAALAAPAAKRRA